MRRPGQPFSVILQAKVIKAQDPAEKEKNMKAAVGVAAPNTLARFAHGF